MTNYELNARKVGWFPTREAHVLFKGGNPASVCRHLRDGERYTEDTDTLISTPLRHAANWQDACTMDGVLP